MDDLSSITDRLRLLADPTRIRVLNLLAAEELTVGELASALAQGQSTVSSQLARLREAELVQDRRDGTRSFYRLGAAALANGERRFWDLLEEQLAEDPVLVADRERMERVVLARQGGSWVDRAAGSLDRRYVPGRSFETLAVGLSTLLELGDCIDMGSGDGSLLELLAPACRSLICLDQHEGMIAAGKRRMAATRSGRFRKVRFLLGDMHAPPLEDGCADSVLFLQSLQYADRPAQVIAAAAQLLRPNGACLLLTLGKHKDRRIQAEYGHRHLGFTPAMLRKWLSAAGFEVLVCERRGHDARSPQLPILVAHGRK